MKKLLVISIVYLLIQSFMSVNASSETTSQPENAIKIGNAKVAVFVMVIGDGDMDSTFRLENFVKDIDISCATRSIFDTEWDDNLTPLTMSLDEFCIYHQEVPLECKEQVGGLRLFRNSEFQGGSECIFHQDTINTFLFLLSPQGDIISCHYPQGDVTDWMNIGMVANNSQMLDPSVFFPRDKSLYDKPWQEITKNTNDTLWPEFLKKSVGAVTLPEFAEDWVVNSLKKYFAWECVLPYVRNADNYFKKKVAPMPMEAYSFLDSINYSPDVFLMNDQNFPQGRFLRSVLLDPDGGFESIGDTPVAQWQEYADNKLTPAMKVRPKLLLDLLSGMSYVCQIDNGKPLTETQIKNIKEGYTDDIGKIILARNEKMLASKNGSDNQQNIPFRH